MYAVRQPPSPPPPIPPLPPPPHHPPPPPSEVYRETHFLRDIIERDQHRGAYGGMSQYDIEMASQEEPLSLTTSSNTSRLVFAGPPKGTQLDKYEDYVNQHHKYRNSIDGVPLYTNRRNSVLDGASSFSHVEVAPPGVPPYDEDHIRRLSSGRMYPNVMMSAPSRVLMPLPQYTNSSHPLVRPRPLAPQRFHYPQRLLNPRMDWEPVDLSYLATYSLISTRTYNTAPRMAVPGSSYGLCQVPPFPPHPAP